MCNHHPLPALTLASTRSVMLCVCVVPLQELEGAPETVNESPFEKGWFVKIKVTHLSLPVVCQFSLILLIFPNFYVSLMICTGW